MGERLFGLPDSILKCTRQRGGQFSDVFTGLVSTRWCPSSLAKLVYKSNNYNRVDIYIYSIHGDYKPTYNLGAPPCRFTYVCNVMNIFK